MNKIISSDAGRNYQVGGGQGRKTANYAACICVCGYEGGRAVPILLR